MNRTGEADHSATRRSRFFQVDGYWYYSTREKVNIGPFDSLQDAERGASAFIEFVMHAEPDVVESLKIYSSAA